MAEISTPDAIALQRLLDENAILNLIARFDDAVILSDFDEFRSLWTDNAVWDIGDPLPLHAEGVDVIVDAVRKRLDAVTFFFRATWRAVITINGDQASSRAATIENGRLRDGKMYDNLGVYRDKLERQNKQWKFGARRYDYIWIDRTPISPGEVIALPHSLIKSAAQRA